ncbi:hypothetical protein MHYP_G00124860 [Metynnis hypsauchen]
MVMTGIVIVKTKSSPRDLILKYILSGTSSLKHGEREFHDWRETLVFRDTKKRFVCVSWASMGSQSPHRPMISASSLFFHEVISIPCVFTGGVLLTLV